MSVTRADVDRIAELARLRFDDDEADRLTGEMNRILEHADRLRAADSGGEDAAGAAGSTGGVVPSDGAPGERASSDHDVRGARADGADGRDQLVRPPADFSPRFEEGFFVVPPPHGVQAES